MVDIFKQLVTTVEARNAVKSADAIAKAMAEHCDARIAEKDAAIARLSADLAAAREALVEILRVAVEETIPDRHGKKIGGCSQTLLGEVETLARAVLAKLAEKGTAE